MVTLTEQPEAIVAPAGRRTPLVRFAAAFAFGLAATLAIVAGAILAFDASYAGRILPGVHVGAVDVSGLTREAAEGRLASGFASLSDGELVLAAEGQTATVTYGELGRRLDLAGMIDRAVASGRAGSPLERIVSDIRIAVGGVSVEPAVTLDQGALRAALSAFADKVDVPARDASVSNRAEGFLVALGGSGRAVDRDAVFATARAALLAIGAPARVEIAAPVVDIQPAISTDDALAARKAADWMAGDVVLLDGEESWTIPGDSIRAMISFGIGPDGTYGPVVSREGLEAALVQIATKVARAPVDATFLLSHGSTVVGVTEGKNGRSLDVPATLASVEKLLRDSAKGIRLTRVPITSVAVEPDLTTAEALQSAPLMQPISEWTTYFPIGIKNGNGANIWIPARALDGLVVGPGQWFDFWKAIGPITREKGYTDGGAIINGRTEPQGALAGGICSCSTTMFNAALRAGLQMGARRNHYYYIDRYPLGLDATVFSSSSGSVQTMTWRNDTNYPILIRSFGWNVGSKGYVKFVLWSVPTGRTVELTTPIVKNIKPAADTVEYTSTLKAGVRVRVEFPVDGKDVWVTRIVRDASGAVIHQETYYSHYSRMTGITQVGTGGTTPVPTPPPTPPPTPEPTPEPTTSP